MKNTILPGLILLLITGTSAIGAVRLVPDEYPTIQAAIDDCNDGDVVTVKPGTYTGEGNRDIDFHGKPIVVRSTDPNDPNVVALTIIDCNGTKQNPHRAFYFQSGEDANSILSGLTITYGCADSGAGVYCDKSSPKITNCIIAWNTAFETPRVVEGGGIACQDCNPVITNCVISNNEASYGGGIYCHYRASPIISNCTFRGNLAHYDGGGMYCRASSPKLTNCTFSSNSARCGGGVHNLWSSTTLTDCGFISNSGQRSGGGMHIESSYPTVTGCEFSANSGNKGGGVYIDGGSSKLTKCLFNCNLGDYGGGIYNKGSYPIVSSCIFTRNSAEIEGGGMYNWGGSVNGEYPKVVYCRFISNSAAVGGGVLNLDCDPMFSGCLFSGNMAEIDGGGMCDNQGNPTLFNCVFNTNSAIRGGGLHNNYSEEILNNCTFCDNLAQYCGGGIYSSGRSNTRVTNCILWGNSAPKGPEIALFETETCGRACPIVSVLYCNVKGGQANVYVSAKCIIPNNLKWASGNIDADPCFADPNRDDYHLKSQAGRWDPNIQAWVQDHVTSPCIDAGDMASPIGLEPFPNGGIINMGAYGGTAEASKSYFGSPLCKTIVAGDINGDCRVDFADFGLMAFHWLEDHNP